MVIPASLRASASAPPMSTCHLRAVWCEVQFMPCIPPEIQGSEPRILTAGTFQVCCPWSGG
jgi:hypothetical protein